MDERIDGWMDEYFKYIFEIHLLVRGPQLEKIGVEYLEQSLYLGIF